MQGSAWGSREQPDMRSLLVTGGTDGRRAHQPLCACGFLPTFCRRRLWRWNRDNAAIFDPSFGNDVIGKVLQIFGGSLQRRHHHAVVVVEMDMQRRQREIVMAVEILNKAPREIARSMVVVI